MRSLVARRELCPCGGEHERCGEAPSRAWSKKITHTTHSAMARAGVLDRERNMASGAKRRIPPSRGDQACMRPAVRAAARKTTLVTSDTTGQVCAEAGIATAAGAIAAAGVTGAASMSWPVGLSPDGRSGTSGTSTGCVGTADASSWDEEMETQRSEVGVDIGSDSRSSGCHDGGSGNISSA
eukprot:1900285-Pleurochrysis_carterae.AAC.1